MIWAVDFQNNVVLGEYLDIETLQLLTIWFPIWHLYNVEVPIYSNSKSEKIENLQNHFEKCTKRIDSIYAWETLI